MNNFIDVLNIHFQKYPLMQAEDIYKLAYQFYFGPAHFINDKEKTYNYLINEAKECTSKKIDVIWNGMTITEELKKNIDLSMAYATNYQCVVTRTSNVANYVNANSIKDKKVAVEAGSAGELAAEGVANLNKVTSQEAALLEVKAGTSDCAIIDVTMANSVVSKGDFTDLSTISANLIAFEKEDFGVGARKGSDLTEKLNVFFKDSYKSGLLNELSVKYNVAINEATLK